MTPPSFQLVMRTGPTPGKTFALSGREVYIGRDISNEIVINDAEISRRHVRFVLQEGRYIIEDLGSTNGTFIDGQRISGPHALTSGESIMLGENVTLAYSAAQYDPDATMAAASDRLQPAPPAPAPTPAYVPPPQPAYAPPPPQAYAPPPPVYAPAPPAYASPQPVYPEVEEPAPAPKKRFNPWLLGGCGCLLAGTVCVAIPLFLIDYFNYWCTVFPFIGGCP